MLSQHKEANTLSFNLLFIFLIII